MHDFKEMQNAAFRCKRELQSVKRVDNAIRKGLKDKIIKHYKHKILLAKSLYIEIDSLAISRVGIFGFPCIKQLFGQAEEKCKTEVSL